MKKKEFIKLIENFDDECVMIVYGHSPDGSGVFAVDIKSVGGNESEIHIEPEMKLTPIQEIFEIPRVIITESCRKTGKHFLVSNADCTSFWCYDCAIELNQDGSEKIKN